MWAKAFIVASAGRNGQSRVNRSRTGHFESFQQTMGHRAVSHPLAPGSRSIGTEDSGPECKKGAPGTGLWVGWFASEEHTPQ